jgi:hypothetical protein
MQKRKAEAAATGRALLAKEQQAVAAPTKMAPTTWATIAGERSCCGAFSSTNVFCTLRVRAAAPLAGVRACGGRSHSQPPCPLLHRSCAFTPSPRQPRRRRCCSSSRSSPSGCP